MSDELKALVKALAIANKHPDPDAYVAEVVAALTPAAPAA
jgi:hypothetical protein